MVDLHVGRNGAIVLAVVFLLLAAEDLLIWVNQGVVPGLEFMLASVIVLGVLAYVIREAVRHPLG